MESAPPTKLTDAYPVVCYPDPILRRKTAPITEIDDDVRRRAQEMVEIMYQAKGVGLAGPQAGWGARICVLNCTGEKGAEGVYINPRIVKAEGDETLEEGCLSLPGIHVKIRRTTWVNVEAYDLNGNELYIEAEGIEARAWQHEIDHLDGVLIVDRMSPAQRLFHARALKELEQDYRERQRGS